MKSYKDIAAGLRDKLDENHGSHFELSSNSIVNLTSE
jgi:hypothetical protein